MHCFAKPPQLACDPPAWQQAALNKLRADKDKEADGLKAIIAEFEKKAKAMQVSLHTTGVHYCQHNC
jgi:hypothetical protein